MLNATNESKHRHEKQVQSHATEDAVNTRCADTLLCVGKMWRVPILVSVLSLDPCLVRDVHHVQREVFHQRHGEVVK